MMKKEMVIETVKELSKRIANGDLELFTKESLVQLSDLGTQLKTFKANLTKETKGMKKADRETLKGELSILIDFLEGEIEVRGMEEMVKIMENKASNEKVKKAEPKKSKKAEPKKEEPKKSKKSKVVKEEPKKADNKETKKEVKKAEPKKTKVVNSSKNGLNDFSKVQVDDKYRLTFNREDYAQQLLQVTSINKKYIVFEVINSENIEDIGEMHIYSKADYEKGYRSLNIVDDGQKYRLRYILNAM